MNYWVWLCSFFLFKDVVGSYTFPSSFTTVSDTQFLWTSQADFRASHSRVRYDLPWSWSNGVITPPAVAPPPPPNDPGAGIVVANYMHATDVDFLVTFAYPNNVPVGFIFRYQDANNYILLTIACKKNTAPILTVVLRGIVTPIVLSIPTTNIPGGATVTNSEFIMKGNSLSVYSALFTSGWMYPIPMSIPSCGSFGFAGGSTLTFSNFRLTDVTFITPPTFLLYVYNVYSAFSQDPTVWQVTSTTMTMENINLTTCANLPISYSPYPWHNYALSFAVYFTSPVALIAVTLADFTLQFGPGAPTSAGMALMMGSTVLAGVNYDDRFQSTNQYNVSVEIWTRAGNYTVIRATVGSYSLSQVVRMPTPVGGCRICVTGYTRFTNLVISRLPRPIIDSNSPQVPQLNWQSQVDNNTMVNTSLTDPSSLLVSRVNQSLPAKPLVRLFGSFNVTDASSPLDLVAFLTPALNVGGPVDPLASFPSVTPVCNIYTPPGLTTHQLRCYSDSVTSGSWNVILLDVVHGIYSLPSFGRISFKPPTLIPGTLTKFKEAPTVLVVDNITIAYVISVTTVSERVSMKASGIDPSDIANLRVFYGPNNVRECTVDPSSTNLAIGLIVCKTEDRNLGPATDLKFALAMWGYSDGTQGLDYYSYADPPAIYQVSGCSDQSNGTSFEVAIPNGTINCPTAGSPGYPNELYLTITGDKFTLGVVIQIGSVDCVLKGNQPIDANTLLCLLPPGTGLNQPITALLGPLVSYPVELLSYAPPLIQRVYGCVPSDNLLYVSDCDRYGTSSITLTGMNFGPDNAVVFVGGGACLNITQDLITPHTLLNCIVPPGVGLMRPVVVLQYRGEFSKEAYISYQQCSPGMYASGRDCFPCPNGTYASGEGQQYCGQCNPGSWSESGASQCTNCEPGTYSDGIGSTACKSCGVGLYTAVAGQSLCVSCPPGTYSNSSSCPLCPAGTYRDIGDPYCIPCSPNHASGVSGQKSCSICVRGKYAPGNGSIVCDLCPEGRYSQTDGGTCTACNPGLYQPQAGSTICLSCAPGRYQAHANGSTCIQCDPHYYQVNGGATYCTSCPAPIYNEPNAGSTECTTCAAGKYLPFKDGAVKGTCTDCPTNNGLYCDNGLAIAAERYYLQIDRNGMVVSYPCASKFACTGCTSANVETLLNTSGGGLATEQTVACNACGENRMPPGQNFLCAKCQEGAYEWGGVCVTCDHTEWGTIFGLLFATFVYVVIFHLMAQTTTGDMKVFIYFVQAAYVIIQSQKQWLQWAWLAVLNWELFSSTNFCLAPLGPRSKVLIGLVTPLILFIELFLAAFLNILYLAIFKRGTKFKKSPFLRTAVGLMLFAYTSITSTCLQVLSCVNVGGVFILQAYPAVSCGAGSNYGSMLAGAIVLLLTVTIGIPSFLMWFLYKNHNRIKDEKFIRRYAILYENYKDEFWWSEVYNASRRLALVAAIVAFAPIDKRPQQLTCLMALCLIFLFFHIRTQPFLSSWDNMLETASLSIITVLVMMFTPFLGDVSRGVEIAVYVATVLWIVTLIALILGGRIKSVRDRWHDFHQRRLTSLTIDGFNKPRKLPGVKSQEFVEMGPTSPSSATFSANMEKESYEASVVKNNNDNSGNDSSNNLSPQPPKPNGSSGNHPPPPPYSGGSTQPTSTAYQPPLPPPPQSQPQQPPLNPSYQPPLPLPPQSQSQPQPSSPSPRPLPPPVRNTQPQETNMDTTGEMHVDPATAIVATAPRPPPVIPRPAPTTSPAPIAAPIVSTPIISPATFAPVVSPAAFAPVVSPATFAPVVSPAAFAPVVAPAAFAPIVSPAPASIIAPAPSPATVTGEDKPPPKPAKPTKPGKSGQAGGAPKVVGIALFDFTPAEGMPQAELTKGCQVVLLEVGSGAYQGWNRVDALGSEGWVPSNRVQFPSS